MANNGYISSSGIDQVFTTGPYVGSIVTSSYSSGTSLLGPTVTFYQAFVSGSDDDPNAVESIVPCSNTTEVFQRWYYDPINCPAGGCFPPTITSTAVQRCYKTNDFNYYLYFNSGSTNAEYSTIEYSTDPDFLFNTGLLVVTNSLSNYTSSINIGNLPLLPLKSSFVYFRVFNSCSLGGTSSYSPVASASCQVTPPPGVRPFPVRLRNSMVGSNNTIYYTNNGVEYALFGGNTVDLTILTLSSLEIPFRTIRPNGNVYEIIVSSSFFSVDGFVTTQLIDNTPTELGYTVYQSVNTYPSNLYYNTEGTPDASIIVDRTLWSNAGLLEINFTSLIPSDGNNPWYYVNFDIGVGGGGS
jgi:hypothetical protein